MKRTYDFEGLARRYGFNVREVEKVLKEDALADFKHIGTQEPLFNEDA